MCVCCVHNFSFFSFLFFISFPFLSFPFLSFPFFSFLFFSFLFFSFLFFSFLFFLPSFPGVPPLAKQQNKKTKERNAYLEILCVCVCVCVVCGWVDGWRHTASHEITQEWAHGHQETGTCRNLQVESKHCDQCKALHTRIQKIPIPQGCLLVWSSLLMHGNHPNHSTQWRCCQYIRAMPVVGTPYSPLCPERFFYPETFVPTELGEKLFGLKPWEKEDGRERENLSWGFKSLSCCCCSNKQI